MKKQLLTILAAGTACTAFAQLPVSTAPQNKKAVLEEFTGIHCGYCPDGHKIATDLYNNNAGQVILINIHSGSFATASAGEPDFKTAMGTAIDGMPGMGITGYPAGDVNRVGSPMADGRGTWSGKVTTTIAQSAYCNVALEGSLDVNTRVLTYTAQVYYTANSPASTNSLTIMLLEDKIAGPQSNYGNYNPTNYNADGSYNHNHVLRAGLSPNFGITIPTTTSGTTFTTSGTYTVPATYGAAGKTTTPMFGNLELAAFVTESNVNTINGAYGPVTLTNITNAIDGGLTNLKADNEVCAGNLQPSNFTLTNYGSSNITAATINYSVTGGSLQAYNFSGNLAPYTSTVVTLPVYSFAASASNTLSVFVTNVNGSTDANATNDLVTKSIPLTTKIANSTNMSMEFTQDRYGSELTWSVKEEVSGTTVASGGPYSDLSANGVLLHTQAFTVNPNLCYKVTVNDSYGDGFNAGYGAGKYEVKDNGTVLVTMNGIMGSENIKLYKTSSTASGVEELGTSISNVSLFPNPAKNNTTLSIDLVQTENVTINVLNTIGQVVHTQTLTNASAGNHEIKLNADEWAAGVYNVNITVGNGKITRKLVINK